MSEILDKAKQFKIPFTPNNSDTRYYSIEQKEYETLVNKLEEMEKQCEAIYNAYHHGEEQDLDKVIQELIFKQETDWNDEE